MESLTVSRCWDFLENADFGRLAVLSFDGMPDVFPVNYLAAGGDIFMRSAPGAKLRSIAGHPSVAFEVDGEDAGFRWSVVVRGVVERLSLDADIDASGVASLVTASPTVKQIFLRLVPRTVSGRRFRDRRNPLTRGLLGGVPATALVNAARSRKPHPIPHFAPPAGSDQRSGLPGR
ncbi:pyridoxamine 5'-phosphate oxidase family protein [Microbacterium sp. P07]|uniref:pyridoxamine 5'-phosphate oxidase family protein n=1 Tax=Microbacterium sp. P07 TaxID=3366952 RepID=UPI0037458276